MGAHVEVAASTAPVLRVEDLCVHFETPVGRARAVDGVSFTVAAGETLGIVGESGCGKSVTALTMMRLLSCPPAHIGGGHVWLGGRDLVGLPEREMRRLRGGEISMIFQEPMTSLNPMLTVGHQLRETIRQHRHLSAAGIEQHALDMLHMVQMPDPKRQLTQYPFELSGGMRQRIMIAMALSCEPQVLIADEPTTALDVTIQAQILDLIIQIKRRTRTAVVLITHDLGVIAETAQRVVVMYAGRIVEDADVQDLFRDPRHPYTRGLLASLPRRGQRRDGSGSRLNEIAGTVPPLTELGFGCGFASRCPLVSDRCRVETPPLETKARGHRSACFNIAADHGVTA